MAGSGWGQEIGEHDLWVEYAGLGVDGILDRSMASIDLAELRKAVREQRYRFTGHALRRMSERRCTRAEALAVVEVGEVVDRASRWRAGVRLMCV